jgi:hypothetical protein
MYSVCQESGSPTTLAHESIGFPTKNVFRVLKSHLYTFGMCGASNEFGAHLRDRHTWMSPKQKRLFMIAMERRERKREAALDPSFDVWGFC